MGRKPKLSVEQKANICEQYLGGKKSVRELSQEFDVGVTIIRLWSKMYQANGVSGLQTSLHNATYTKEFKQQVVEVCWRHPLLLFGICQECDIPFLCFIDIGFGADFPWCMHIMQSDAAVDHFHAVVC